MKNSWQVFIQLLRDSLVWSDSVYVHPAKIVVATLSFICPILLGIYLNNLSMGVGMAVASYLIATDPLPEKNLDKIQYLTIDIVSLTLATFIGILFKSNSVQEILAFLCLVGFVALIGSFSRALNRLSTLFIVMLIIARNLGQHGADAVKFSELFLYGSFWIVFLTFTLEPLMIYFIPEKKIPVNDGKIVQDPKFKHLWNHWTHSLQHLSGWLYTIRLVSCLVVAEIYLQFFPNQHAYWIFITIAIVVHRNPREALLKKVQRSLGTLVGITLASFLLVWQPPVWLLLIFIALLAGVRPVVKAKSYLAYSFIITPLVMLLLDLNQRPTVEVLMDRLLAAFLGSAIAFFVGYYFWRARMLRDEQKEKGLESS